jgi:hypothetical protein
MRMDKV